MMMLPGVIAYHLYGGVGEDGGLASIDLAYPRLIRDVLPVEATGFFLAVLLGAVFSSFNSLLNSAATLFCLDVYLPYKEARGVAEVDDALLLKVAKRASIAIALFSFLVAPLLQFAADGLWQVIRVFTGFYNIPIIAIVIVGLFTRHVPALGAKLVIIFHVIAYGLLQFVFKEAVDIHFLHLYAVLFAIEISILLAVGHFYPRTELWSYSTTHKVDMQPWAYAVPCAVTLMSCVVALYLLFSPIGIVGGLSDFFWPLIASLFGINILFWGRYMTNNSTPTANPESS
jgi:SSS family solute:Na+ symporter